MVLLDLVVMGTDDEMRCSACTGGRYRPRVTLGAGGGAITGVCDTCGHVEVLRAPPPRFFEPEPEIYRRLAAMIEAERQAGDGGGAPGVPPPIRGGERGEIGPSDTPGRE